MSESLQEDELHLLCWDQGIAWFKIPGHNSDAWPRQQKSTRERNSGLQLPAKIQTSSDWLSLELNYCSVISVKCANDSQPSYGWTSLSSLRTTDRAGPLIRAEPKV